MPKWDGPALGIGRLPKNQREYGVRFTSAARKARALRKLGVSPDQLASAQQITPFLKDIRGGLKAVLGTMRFSKDPVVLGFLGKRDSLGVWARENTCWEAIALAAGIDPLRLLGAALLAWREYTTTVGKLHRRLSASRSGEKASRVRPTPRRMARSRFPP